ncbi:fibronectin type III domain-containing protein [Streptomyces thermocoprophilus]|uniref:Fibronectin type III domain-containing protein n=1 Tax=Streptomyces thermocoprophilus TaxID=78356 RepID=A0ABV5VG72_9ACTN
MVSGVRSIAPPQHVAASTTDTDVVLSWREPSGTGTTDPVVRRSPATADGSRDRQTVTCGDRTTSADASGDTVDRCVDATGRHGTASVHAIQRRDGSGRLSLPSAEVTATRPATRRRRRP